MAEAWNPADPNMAPLIAPAWRAAMELLADDRWHSRLEVEQAMRAASDLVDKTIAGQIDRGVQTGWLAKKLSGGINRIVHQQIKITPLARRCAPEVVGPFVHSST